MTAPPTPSRVVPPRWHNVLYRWLSAPILVAIVVALLVNYVIPRISERSENHRRSLEIKTGLVSDISRSATDAIISSRFVAGDVIKKESSVKGQQRFFDEGLREWETKRGELQARIDAYFPKTLSAQWRGLATVITDLYTLSGSEIPDRELLVKRISTYVGNQRSVRMGGWCALERHRPRPELEDEDECTRKPKKKLEPNERDNHFRGVYKTVGYLLLSRTDAFVRDVLDTDISGF